MYGEPVGSIKSRNSPLFEMPPMSDIHSFQENKIKTPQPMKKVALINGVGTSTFYIVYEANGDYSR